MESGMNTSRFKATASRARTAWSAMVAVGMAILFSATALAQAPAAASSTAPPAGGDLTQLVGRIALYPDDLIAIILPAATSPLQIVQADRYLDKRKSDPKLPIDDKWDDPVKSLLNYPDVVKMMSNDLDWTSALGEEVVTDQGAVLEAVQVFRRQAQSAGNLKSDTKQVVKTEKEVIIIEPADPQVVYVPQYNPSTVVVYGAPAWGYYPTPYPSYYYPYAPGAAMAAGVIWGAAIGAAWSGNRYGWGGGNDININRNTNISTGGNTINRGQGGGQGGQWKSNKQPGQVSSSVGKSAPSSRVGDARGGAGAGAGGGARASAQPAGGYDRGGGAGGGDRGGAGAGGDRAGAGAGGGARPSTQPAGGGGRSGGGDSAFGGYNSGRQTSMDSSRGASSRGSSYGGSGGSSYGGGGGSRPTASSNASRGGGGGGASRGGGGGGRGGGGRR
jgi:hypothetical protein